MSSKLQVLHNKENSPVQSSGGWGNFCSHGSQQNIQNWWQSDRNEEQTAGSWTDVPQHSWQDSDRTNQETQRQPRDPVQVEKYSIRTIPKIKYINFKYQLNIKEFFTLILYTFFYLTTILLENNPNYIKIPGIISEHYGLSSIDSYSRSLWASIHHRSVSGNHLHHLRRDNRNHCL